MHSSTRSPSLIVDDMTLNTERYGTNDRQGYTGLHAISCQLYNYANVILKGLMIRGRDGQIAGLFRAPQLISE